MTKDKLHHQLVCSVTAGICDSFPGIGNSKLIDRAPPKSPPGMRSRYNYTNRTITKCISL